MLDNMYRLFLLPLAALTLLILMAACSSSRSISSVTTSEPITVNGNLSGWPTQAINRSASEEFDIAVANNDEFVFIAISFKNLRVQQMARDFGFRIYLDSDKNIRRSFGIVYPIGLVTALADYPASRQAYLENPGWRNMPDNRRLIESLERDMPSAVQIISRTESRSAVRPAFVPMEQLRANDIHVAIDPDSRMLLVELKIPIKSSRDRQFSVDDDGNNIFNLGLEVVAPDYEEITGDRPTYETVDASQDRRDPYGTGRRGTRTQLQVSNPQLYQLLNYHYQFWTKIRLNQ